MSKASFIDKLSIPVIAAAITGIESLSINDALLIFQGLIKISIKLIFYKVI